jgi:ABC-type transporter lipoprotein component MlaA
MRNYFMVMICLFAAAGCTFSASEDLGQTLAIHGFGDGFYIVWPLLGRSTLRFCGHSGQLFFKSYSVRRTFGGFNRHIRI